MYPNPVKLSQRLSRQRGNLLLVAIFILVAMSLLSLALVQVSRNADDVVSLEVWGARALNAANSGVDAALSQLFPLANDGEIGNGCNDISTSWTPPSVGGFHACTVVLECKQMTIDDESQYRLRSTAICESTGSDEQRVRVSRTVEVEAHEQ